MISLFTVLIHLNEYFMRNFIFIVFLIACGKETFPLVEARLTVEEANEMTLAHCIHEDSIEVDYAKMDILPVILACTMETKRAKDEKRGVRKMVITSNCRPQSTNSMHRHCAAIDFYYEYLGGWDSCQVWTAYKDDSWDIYDWFFMINWNQYLSQGVYLNLTHHIHGEGSRTLWGFDNDGSEIPFMTAHDLIDKRIQHECD